MKASLILASCLVGSVAMLAVTARPAQAAAAKITAFSSTGGTSQNKDNDQDIMYLIAQGETLTFSATFDQNVTCEWSVQKAVERTSPTPSTSDKLVWTVPGNKGIWEIHLRCWNAAKEETHHEWVVSTLPAAEAPDFFDCFADKQFATRKNKDPWGRDLPAWRKLYGGPDCGQGYVKSVGVESYLSTKALSGKNIARGTFKFWMYWHDGGSANTYSPTSLFAIMNNSREDTNIREGLHLENPYDEHLWLFAHDSDGKAYDCISEGNSFGINEYPVNVEGWRACAGWHQWTFIIDEDDEVYLYMDDDAAYSTRGHMD
ncbi:MAG: hypothetical protein KKE37_06855, partial [Verrucomicrobia bacterium]|nr:hypothetical protein [Verrucomicrobiota bacterium]